jgi:uncharacterized protein with GYD domain
MAKYLLKGNYVGEGVTGLRLEGGTRRRAAIDALVTSVGGMLEGVYFAFGETDIYVVADLPDHASAVALTLAANATGAVAVTTTVLLTPEEMDAAAHLDPQYRAPGV